jgi:hypothetical protein
MQAFDEHIIIEKEDKSLVMYIRVKEGIAESYSIDKGKSWTDPVSSKIKTPTARFFVSRLNSGNLILVKNGKKIDEAVPYRYELTAFLSDDDGETWKGGLMLDDRRERTGVSYPSGVQAENGTIYMVHDYDRQVEKEIILDKFTEEDILDGKLVSENSKLGIVVNKATGKNTKIREKVGVKDFENKV